MLLAAEELDETLISLDEFAELWAEHERHGARLALAAARFEAAGAFGVDGAVSMLTWLRDKCRMSDTDAARLVRLGRFLARHQVVAEAAVESRLSAGQIAALRNNVKSATESIFGECAEELVDAIAPLNVRDTEVACAHWRKMAEAITAQPEPSVPERKLNYDRSGDGAMIGNFVFDEALAAVFEKALGIAITWEGADDTRTTSTRQADAMFDIFSFFSANHAKEGTPRHRPHVEMGVDIANMGDDDCCASTVDGHPFPASTADAFLCDSRIQRFVMNGSMPIDIGHTSRTVPVHIFRAVARRDGGCRHPGCDRKIAWCDAHHVTFWRHGGSTGLHNLVLLCARHHHLIHRPGWQLKLLPDGTVEVTKPDGKVLASGPKPRVTTKHIKRQT